MRAATRTAVLLAVGIATVAITLVALWLAGWRVAMFPSGLSDSVGYFTPKSRYVSERLAHGTLPLWNPYEYGGIPLLATLQPAVLYPPGRLVQAFLADDAAHVAFFLLHIAIAAVCTVLLLRDLGCDAAGAAVGVGWVTTPTWLIAIYDHPGYLASLAWVPLALLLVRRIVLAPTLRGAMALGAVIALQVLAGYPPFVIVTGYLLVTSLPCWWVDGRTTVRWGRTVAALALAGLACTLLVAAQVLPTSEYLSFSARLDEVRGAHATFLRLVTRRSDVAEALNLPMATVTQGAARLWHDHGPVPLVLAIAAPLFAPRRAVVYWALAVAAFCSLAPLRLVYRLPGYAAVRFGVEWWFVAPFALHLVSALGLSSWRDRFHSRTATALIAASLVIGGATWWNWRAADIGHMLVRSVRPPPVPVSSLADCVGPSRAFRLFWPGADVQGVPLDARLTSVVGYEPSMRPARMMTLLARLGLETSAWAANLAAHPTVAARLALRCVQTPKRQVELERAGWDVVPTTAPKGMLHVRRDAPPRWRLTHDARAASSPEEALDAVFAPETRPSTVVLEGAPAPLPPCADAARDRVAPVDVSPERVALDVTSECEAYLVLADTWAPGWVATVDGRPATIERADYVFRGVRIAPGTHRIVFTYRPRSVRVGLALSLSGIVLALAVALVPSRIDPLAR